MNYKQTLAELEVGDVVVLHRSSSRGVELATVTKRTPKRVYLFGREGYDGTAYRIDTGRSIGDNAWYWSIIEPVTAKGLEQLRLQEMENKRLGLALILNDTNFRDYPANVLENIQATLSAYEKLKGSGL